MGRIEKVVTTATLLSSMLYLAMSCVALVIVISGIYFWLNGSHLSFITLGIVLFAGGALGFRGVWLFWTALRTKRERPNYEILENGIKHE